MTKHKQFQSWEIQNEMLMLMVTSIVRKLCCEIRTTSQFALIVDWTSDNTSKEQEAIAIRWVCQ